MIVYLVRHAWAGHSGDLNFPDDRLRPLTRKGRKRFRKLVHKLAERSFAPRTIATSPLTRCEQTANIVAEEVDQDAEVVLCDALAPGGDHRETLRKIAAHGEHDIACVGHAPDIEEFAALLIGDDSAGIRFDKGAVAAIEFSNGVAAGQGTLRWLVTADLLLKPRG